MAAREYPDQKSTHPSAAKVQPEFWQLVKDAEFAGESFDVFNLADAPENKEAFEIVKHWQRHTALELIDYVLKHHAQLKEELR